MFIDRVTINGTDGKPVGSGSNRLGYLVDAAFDFERRRPDPEVIGRRVLNRFWGMSSRERSLTVGAL